VTAADDDGTGLARGMAWFGIALGAAELVAPRLLGRVIGVRTGAISRTMIRAMGVREVATGVAILLRGRRPLPVWARVAGDAGDLAALGLAAMTGRTTPRTLVALAAVGGATALDVIAARRVQDAFDESNPPIMAAVTVNRSPAEVYGFYRKLERLPVFMEYIESISVEDATTSHWIARLPLAGKIGFTAEIVEDIPDRLIAWRAKDTVFQHEGRVTFTKAPGRNATEVRVELKLGVTGVGASAELARLFARPQVRGDLRRLKQLLETGEILRSDASAHTGPHPAQPADDATPSPPIALKRPPTAEKGATP
jgi:uncharacterized membrane protein